MRSWVRASPFDRPLSRPRGQWNAFSILYQRHEETLMEHLSRTILNTFFCSLLFCCMTPLPLSADQTVSGFIEDAANGESLIGVNVYIKGTGIGSTTNKSGYYIITNVPMGSVILVASYIGYKKQEIAVTIRPGESRVLNITMKTEAIQGEVVQVTADKVTKTDVKTSLVKVTPRKLKSAPVMAEPDLMRMLQMLPGVLTLSEFSSGLFIRGGTPDQNLILLDGTEIYNVNHLFGIFSTFDVDAVKQVDLIKGGFPAQYGGRMSSVLDITNMDGNQKQFEGKTSIGLISAKTTLQGPVEKGSWFFSGRRTYIDAVINGIEKSVKGKLKETLETIPDYYFYDVHFKLYQDLNHRNKFALTLYRGRDNMNFAVDPFEMVFSWGNTTVTGKWTHIFSERFFVNFYATYSSYNILLEEDDAFANMLFDNTVDDMTVKSNAEVFLTPRHTFKTGFQYKWLDSDFIQRLNQQEYLFGSKSTQYTVYALDNWTVSPLVDVQIGLRLNLYQPRRFVNTFDRVDYTGKIRFDWEPRLALQYRLTEQTTLKGSWGNFIQYMTIVPFGNADFSFMDLWFPTDNSYNPGKSDHYIVGIGTVLPSDIRFDLEVYYKYMPHVYESNPNVSEVLTGSDLFHSGQGTAYGMDVYLEKNVGDLSGWLSYSFGWTQRKFPELNGGKPFFPKYDRRHYVNLVLTASLSERWKANFAWTYGTGQAYTQPMSHYELHLPDRTVNLVIGEERNVSRLPAYHRADVGIQYKSKQSARFLKQWGFYIQIYNLYNRRNLWFRRVDPEQHPPEALEIRMLPTIPTFGFEFYF